MLILDEGVWNVVEPIVLGDEIAVRGAGPKTLLRAMAPIDSIFDIPAGSRGTRIASMRLEGGAQGKSQTLHRGIYVHPKARDVAISDVIFSGPRQGTGFNLGIDIYDAFDVRVHACAFDRLVSSNGNGTGILVEGRTGANSTIEGNMFDGREVTTPTPGGSAIFVTSGASHVSVIRNQISDWPQAGIAVNDSTYGGIALLPPVTDLQITGNVVARSAHAGIVVTAQTSRVNIDSNTVIRNGRHGIVVEGNNFQPLEVPRGIQVVKNRVHENGRNGIYIAGAVGSRVAANDVAANGRLVRSSGIQITNIGGSATGADTTVEGNVVRGSTHVYAIRIDNDVANTVLRGNQLQDSLGLVADYGAGTSDDRASSIESPGVIIAGIIVAVLGLYLLHRAAPIGFDRISILTVFYVAYVGMIFVPSFVVVRQHAHDPQRWWFIACVFSVLITVPLGALIVRRRYDVTPELERRFFSGPVVGGVPMMPFCIALALAVLTATVYFVELGDVPLLALFNHETERQIAELRERSFKLLDPRWEQATSSMRFYAYLFLRTHLFPFLVTLAVVTALTIRSVWWVLIAAIATVSGGMYAAASLARAPVAALLMRVGYAVYLGNRRLIAGPRMLAWAAAALSFPILVTTLGYGSTSLLDGIRRVALRLLYTGADDLYAYFLIFPRDVGFQMGGTIVKPFLVALGQPYFYIENYVYRLSFPDGVQTGHSNAAFISNLWADFGIAGVVLGGVLVGAIIQALHFACVKARKTPTIVAIYAFLIYAFWVLNLGSVTSVLGVNGVAAATIALVVVRFSQSHSSVSGQRGAIQTT